MNKTYVSFILNHLITYLSLHCNIFSDYIHRFFLYSSRLYSKYSLKHFATMRHTMNNLARLIKATFLSFSLHSFAHSFIHTLIIVFNFFSFLSLFYFKLQRHQSDTYVCMAIRMREVD